MRVSGTRNLRIACRLQREIAINVRERASNRRFRRAAIKADNGATDYNAAFAKTDADNPNSDARVFLTDGGHDVGEYNEAHLGHRVPTYVVGFGSGVSSGPDLTRLKKIAKDTGGQYFPVKDASQLQAAMNSIGAALTCQTPPRSFTASRKGHHRKPSKLKVTTTTSSTSRSSGSRS